ncbi:MAG: tetratricopeptide repeat protein [Phycisphaerae bacterium]
MEGTATSEDRSNDEQRLMIDAAWQQVEAVPRSTNASATLMQSTLICDADSSAGGLRAHTIPGYEITREIHRGGQGVVYRAVQTATRRKVAIKVMKHGPFAGPADRARFNREAQILGQLKHPNIVTIHDTGVAAGCHYFVMDYISGRSLHKYIAQRTERTRASPVFPVRETLKLLVKVCDAVNAAHVRGIVHRDLKPSNIHIDADREPYILDFGVAKTTEFGLSPGHALQPMTVTGQFIGSLPWASPEQAEGAPAKIDIRTDVYSIGIILYQMLTGRSPYKVTGNMGEVLEHIMWSEPVRPSVLCRRIDNELETIVLKCLAKQRERRYQSAGELACDMRRYLADEPIAAKRDNGWYVLRKQIRKNKLPVTVAVSFVLVVTVGFVTALTSWKHAERDRATAAREADAGRQILDFMVDVFEVSDPHDARSGTTAGRDVLARGVERIRNEFQDRPPVQAALLNTMGRVHTNLAIYGRAGELLGEALAIRRRTAEQHPLSVSDSLVDLASLRVRQNDPAGAEPLVREALAVRRAELGHVDRRTAECARSLGQVLHALHRHDEAEELYREAIDVFRRTLGEDHKHIAACLSDLAHVLRQKENYPAAERTYRRALAMSRRLSGNNSLSVSQSLDDLASVLCDQGKCTEAESLYRESMELLLAAVGKTDTDLPHPLIGLGRTLLATGRPQEAEPYLREALSIRSRACSAKDPRTTQPQVLLGRCMTALNRFTEAERLLLNAHAVLLKSQGPEHALTRETRTGIVDLYETWGKPDRAVAWRVMGYVDGWE